MNKKLIRYAVLIIVLAFVGYNSVYFKKLNDVNKGIVNGNNKLDVKDFWGTKFKIAIDSAIALEVFEDEFIKKGAQVTIEKYSHKQGVSDVAYMLMKFSGKVKEVTEDKIVLEVLNSRTNSFVFNTGNYFGNAVRDATGLIKMGDFENTLEYNNVSTQLNKIVKNEVIFPFKNKLKSKDDITVVGCVEVLNDRLQDEILPVKIILNN
jgi:predicted lipoprotein